MRYRYYLCDIFTQTRFGGNQLAVLPDARGLSEKQMQNIAREFNLTETAFVFPPEAGHTRKVRIFTTTTEVPFSGHPNIGTAFTLATLGEFGKISSTMQVYFEEKAGLVPVSIMKPPGKPLICRLAAPEKLSFGAIATPQSLAAAVSLDPLDIVTETHPPCVASVGLPFMFAELKDRDAMENRYQARIAAMRRDHRLTPSDRDDYSEKGPLKSWWHRLKKDLQNMRGRN